MKTLLITLIILVFSIHLLISEEAEINIKLKKPHTHKINKNVHGAFIEMIRDFVNGPLGIWAQDLRDRGFDQVIEGSDVPQYWDVFHETTEDANLISMWGGYNQNGLRYPRLNSYSKNGICGISQMAYVSAGVESDFYVWARGSSGMELKIRLTNPLLDEILIDEVLGEMTENWKKYSLKIPGYKNIHKYQLALYIQGEGHAELDEASLMPVNNVEGMRKEYYELFKLWSPSILRYPGGGFADNWGNIWYGGIGDIDQRSSPIIAGVGFNVQRLDWGTDEYIKICRILDIEPHIVVNLSRNEPEIAADWVEYCNGSIDTEYGKKRAENGHPEPYNVKMWEIGNEQWGIEEIMCEKYLVYYDAMKAVDPSISCMIDGNIWTERDNFKILLDCVKEKTEIYTWHWASIGEAWVPVTNDTIYYNMLASSEDMTKMIRKFDKKVENNEYSDYLTHGNTEWWLIYDKNHLWLDTAARGGSLECGLANAGCMQAIMERPEYLTIMERTVGITCMINDTIVGSGEKTIYPSPALLSQAMLRKHSGDLLFESAADCGEYNLNHYVGFIWHEQPIPYLKVLTTATEDSLYISVLNRALVDISTEIKTDTLIAANEAKIYELSSNHYLDMNSPTQPNKIKIKESIEPFNWKYTFPKHSFTILAFPFKHPVRVNDYSQNLKLFPNPFTDKLNLELDNSIGSPDKIEIVDLLGRKILSTDDFFDYRVNLDLSKLAVGCYFVNIYYQTEVITLTAQKISR
jgi:alpha-N-arabinofuranosidase